MRACLPRANPALVVRPVPGSDPRGPGRSVVLVPLALATASAFARRQLGGIAEAQKQGRRVGSFHRLRLVRHMFHSWTFLVNGDGELLASHRGLFDVLRRGASMGRRTNRFGTVQAMSWATPCTAATSSRTIVMTRTRPGRGIGARPGAGRSDCASEQPAQAVERMPSVMFDHGAVCRGLLIVERGLGAGGVRDPVGTQHEAFHVPACTRHIRVPSNSPLSVTSGNGLNLRSADTRRDPG